MRQLVGWLRAARGTRVAAWCRAVALGLIACCAPAGVVAQAPEGSAQQLAERTGGVDPADLLRQGDGGVPGLARMRPVLRGVLYRAGFAAGDTANSGLSEAQRDGLCRMGFSGARYVDYARRTHFGVTDCGMNSFDYRGGRAMKPQTLLKDIGRIIDDPDLGPLLLHDRWGVHDAGAVAAMALVQFCGWSEQQALNYWDASRNGSPCAGSCEAWIGERFARFELVPERVPDPGTQQRICPRAETPPAQPQAGPVDPQP